MMPNPTRKRDTNLLSSKGFTLIELLIAMAIASIVLTAIVSVYTALTRSYTTESVRASAQQDLRSAMALMVQDIRLAGLDPLGTAGGVFTTTNAAAIGFFADRDYNGTVTLNNNEWIQYYLNVATGQLMQQLDGGPLALGPPDAVLMNNVTALNFTYNPPPTAATPIASPTTVTISMTITAPAGRAGTVTRTLTELVRIRN